MGTLAALLLQVATNPAFESAALQLLTGIGKELLAIPGIPAEVQLIGDKLLTDATGILGTVVTGTKAQTLVSPTIVAAGAKTVASAEAS